ncbi:MAG: sulfurtransferase [Frankiales bacterium]|nr:sulfurtransferase [Frankiales bacterium]
MAVMFGHRPIPTVAARDVAPDAFILDVREPEEWADGHVDGSVHMPMQTIPERLHELPAEKRITVLCAVGGRSAQVTAWLVAQGYDAVNVDGGIYAWVDAGRPVVSGADPAR